MAAGGVQIGFVNCAAPTSRRWLAVAAALLIASLAATLSACRHGGSDLESGENTLIDAFSKRRKIEARLSGGFKAGLFRPSGDDAPPVDAAALARAREVISDSLISGNPNAQLAYARLVLSVGDEPREALAYLRRALASAPENPEAHNDLGVCLFQQNKLEDALDEFNAALEHKAGMPEALFNRALCYERLQLRPQSLNDLNQLAEIERDEGWLIEVKQRVQQLISPSTSQQSRDAVSLLDAAIADGRLDDAKQLADNNYEAVRKHAVWEVIVQQLQAAVEGDQVNADRAMFELDLIANVFTETRGDSYVADVARHLRQLPESERRGELELTRDYAQRMYKFRLDKDAELAFDRLEKGFRDSGNRPLQASCAFEVAECYYSAKRFRDSIEKLRETLLLVERNEWPRDRAKILNLLVAQYSRVGEDSLAIKCSEQAISLCTKSPELEAKILQYVSAPYQRLGDFDRALASLRDATKLFLENDQWAFASDNLAYNYSLIAQIYSTRSHNPLALLYAEQAVTYSLQANNNSYAAEFSSFAAVEQSRLNRLDEAEAQLQRAFDYVNKLQPGQPRDYAEADVLINAGEIAARSGQTSRALAYYEKAEALTKLGEGHVVATINILRDRARVYAASGQTGRARDDLIRAIDLIEKNRAKLETSDERIEFFAASRSTFDQLISLNAEAPALTSEAFRVSESSRARSLLEEASGRAAMRERDGSTPQGFADSPKPVNPLKLSEVQSQLPEEIALLEYVVTEQCTYVFLVTRSRFKVLKSPANTAVLDRLVHEYVSELQEKGPLDEVNGKARILYDYLIKPAEEEIRGNASLCIVPDEALHFLPFAALVDPAGEYLIKAHRLTYAPSASALVRCIKESGARPRKDLERMLAVGNPDFNRESFANLKPLPDAEREAIQSGRSYAQDSVVLLRDKAREAAVVESMIGCDVVHLALHCVVEEGSPGLAALVLAGASQPGNLTRPAVAPAQNGASRGALSKSLPEEPVNDPNDGLLFLRELYRIKLPRTKLVVLSACQSGLGQYYRGEGIVSLIRPFLISGVPAVVASLWPVDSAATADLMIEFHRQRGLAHLPAGVALQAAQNKLRENAPSQHPYYWAPFILVGAD
ncbi:MAG TPA: CHAT domain-containing protein [Blastocatellia bacterium]|nr:CHAT domain-containing protein [Blastocatellia bacterium]